MRLQQNLLSWVLSTTTLVVAAATATAQQEDYSYDVSFPVHGRVSVNYPELPHNQPGADKESRKLASRYDDMPLQLLGDRQSVYLDHLEGCRNAYAPLDSYKCDQFEYDRMLMNRRQPQSMYNLTETGFLKLRAPDHVVELIDEFWNANKHKLGSGAAENWGAGNTYVNHWESPTELLSVDDVGLRGSGAQLKQHIWAATSATLEEWTQEELQPCSLYGIRVYKKGAIMLPHVDRLPLVASAMINVAQDVDEDWPTEVYDHDGKAHNITLHPGEMLLFESHSVIHGHPFPLKGRFYAMIFIHFEPTGHSLARNETGFYYVRHESENQKQRTKKQAAVKLDRQYRQDTRDGFGGQSSALSDGLPPYIKRESPEEEHWKAFHPAGWTPPEQILPPEAHVAAKEGQIHILQEKLLKEEEESRIKLLTERDEHGWQILHQGVASGNQDVVKLLVSNGAEINARTHGGYGETPLRIAEKKWGADNPIVKYLKSMGALSIGPEL